MQNTKPASAPTWLTTYGPLGLSTLALLIIAVAWILHDVDQATALAVIGAILAGNGLVSATQWQAAPGLVSDLQAVIGQLMAQHIQTLHSQQSTQPSQLSTTRMAAVQVPAAQQPAAPVPSFHSSPTVSNIGNVPAQGWPSPIPPASRTNPGG